MANSFDVVTVTLNPAIDRAMRIPRFTLGAVNRAETPTEKAGGKGVNVACHLARAGLKVAAAGVLGTDNAAIFEELFAKEGISDLCLRRPGKTRDGIKITDPVEGKITEINLPGLAIGEDCLLELTVKLEAIEAKWFVLSGSLPPGLAPDSYASMVSRLKKMGAKVAVDTSGVALGYAIDAGPDLIKPNLEELQGILPGRARLLPSQSDNPRLGGSLASPEEVKDEFALMEAIRGVIARGVPLVAVSMGSQGAVVANAKEATKVLPPSVPLVSTVGAGDAMLAGLIQGDLRGYSLKDQARWGTALASATVAGGLGVYATEQGVRELMEKVQLWPVE